MNFIKTIAAIAALFFAAPALATCTYAQQGKGSGTAVCTTSTEAMPTLTNQGWNFDFGWCPKGVTAFICAETGKTLTAVGSMKLYVWHPVVQLWGEAPNQAQSVTVTGARCQQLDGIWTVVGGGRFAILPSGVTTAAAGGISVWMTCQ
jgi:hypothetical protein